MTVEFSRRQILGWSVAGAGSLVLGACGGSRNSPDGSSSPNASGAGQSSGKKSLSVGLKATVTALSPFATQGYQWSQMLGFTMYDTLVRKDDKGNLIPWIAKSFDTSDPNKTVIQVQQGVKFHDGSPVTAKDVAYSISARANPTLIKQTSGRPIMSPTQFVSCEATGDFEVTVTTKGRVEFLVDPQPVLIVKENSFGSTNYSTHENGSGPFKLGNFTSGSSLQLVANPDYWKSPPALQTLKFQFFSDVATEAANIRSGAVDAIYDVSPLNLPQLKNVSGTKIVQAASYMDWWIPQLGKAPLNNVAVRKALLYCFDIDQMNKASFSGLGKHDWNPFVYTNSSSGVTISGISYDPDKAKSLLAAAGVNDISVPLLGIQGYADADAQAQILMQGLQKAGIKTSYKNPPIAQWLDATYTKGNWEGLAFNAGNQPFPDKNLFDYLVDPCTLLSAYTKGSPLPSVADIYHQVEAQPFASAEEKAQLKAAQQAIVDQVPVYFMFAGPVSVVLPSDLNGVVTNGFGDVFWDTASF